MVRKVSDSNVTSSDIVNTIDTVVSVNPHLNNRITEAYNKSNLFVCEILRFYPVNDKALVKILSNGKIVRCYLTHDILSRDVSLQSMVDGSVNTDEYFGNASYVKPFTKLYGIVALVRVKAVDDEYCLISCINYNDSSKLKSSVGTGEICLQAGDSKVSVTSERVNILCPELFINGLPFSEPDFDNYHNVDEINEINDLISEDIKSIIVDGYYDDGKFYKHYKDGVFSDEVVGDVNKLFLDVSSKDIYCFVDDEFVLVSGGSGGSTNYNDLSNKPKINNVVLSGNKFTSDLNVSYSDLKNKPVIPSKTSELVNDSGFLTSHQSLSNYYTKSQTDSAISGYHDSSKADKSQLNDYTKTVNLDSLIATYGYLKTHQSLENYYTKSQTDNRISSATLDMATKSWVNEQGYLTELAVVSVNGKTGTVVLTPADLGLGSVFKVKGSKPTKTALPVSDNVIGDVWYVIDESVGYIWLNDGTTDRWEQLGLEVDLSNYVTLTELSTTLNNYVVKVAGKELSSNDFTNVLKAKLDSLENYDDTEILNLINTKVDKVSGKQLSSNDFTNSEKSKLATLENYDDSEIRETLENKADNVHSHSINDVTNLTSQLNTKVDKVNGKGLSTVDFTDTNYVHTDNNFTTSEKNKVASLENYDDTEVKSDIQNLKTNKQNKLTAGDNITIINDVISSTGGGSGEIISVGSFNINDDGDLIVTLPSGVSNPYKIVGNNLIYDTGV